MLFNKRLCYLEFLHSLLEVLFHMLFASLSSKSFVVVFVLLFLGEKGGGLLFSGEGRSRSAFGFGLCFVLDWVFSLFLCAHMWL